MSAIRLCIAISLVAPVGGQGPGPADRLESKYVELATDEPASTTSSKTILGPVYVSPVDPANVLIVASGRVTPDYLGDCINAVTTAATLQLRVNGSLVGSKSIVDWRPHLGTSAYSPEIHSFHVAWASPLITGEHVVELVASAGHYSIGKRAALSVFVNPCPTLTAQHSSHQGLVDVDVSQCSLCAQCCGFCSEVCNQDTWTRINHWQNLASENVAAVTVPINGVDPVFMIASGSSSVTVAGPLPTQSCSGNEPPANMGDAMWGLFLGLGGENLYKPFPNGPLHFATWSVNDLWEGAELGAPMFCQGAILFPEDDSPFFADVDVRLRGTEYPAFTDAGDVYNPVQYSVDPSTQLIALTGDFAVSGAVATSGTTYPCNGLTSADLQCSFPCVPAGTTPICRWCNAWCVASPDGPNCPNPGTQRVLAEETLLIGPTHDGIVFFSSMIRALGDAQNAGAARLEIFHELQDPFGVKTIVGSRGVQTFQSNLCSGASGTPLGSPESQRTLCASYLSAPPNNLAPGQYTIRLIGVVHQVNPPLPPPLPPEFFPFTAGKISFYNDHPILIYFG
ncbi:MAG: hypothetical protein AAF628_27600 [Planctomycetota bacterium]